MQPEAALQLATQQLKLVRAEIGKIPELSIVPEVQADVFDAVFDPAPDAAEAAAAGNRNT